MKCWVGVFVLLAMFSCGRKEKKPVFYDLELSSLVETDDCQGSPQYGQSLNDNIISVPFTEKNGVKFIKVSINGFGFKMIFDTGCSGTLISIAEANYLYQKGVLTQEDFIGVTQSQIADGSIVENMVINLKEVIINGQIRCTNVKATVSDNNNAPLLLGNEILNRVATYVVDNENQCIHFKLK